MNEALLDYEGNISIGERTITKLRFFDIDSNLINKIDVTLITYGMEIKTGNTQVISN